MEKSINIKTKLIYISIANFVFFLEIDTVDDLNVQKALKLFITQYYKNIFIEKPKKIDYRITFIAEENIHLIQKEEIKDHTTFYLRTFAFGEKRAFVDYHVSIVHFQMLLKIILQKLLTKNEGFLLHASAVCNSKFAYVFLGKNGAGKSTIAQNLTKYYKKFADDTVIARKIQNQWHAFQMPIEKQIDPLKKIPPKNIHALFLIQKNTETQFLALSKQDKVAVLLEQILGKVQNNKQMQTITRFMEEVPDFKILACQKKAEVKKIKDYFDSLI